MTRRLVGFSVSKTIIISFRHLHFCHFPNATNTITFLSYVFSVFPTYLLSIFSHTDDQHLRREALEAVRREQEGSSLRPGVLRTVLSLPFFTWEAGPPMSGSIWEETAFFLLICCKEVTVLETIMFFRRWSPQWILLLLLHWTEWQAGGEKN